MEDIEKLGGSARIKGRSRSLLWPKVYDALRRKGYGKSKSAAISNAHWNKYRRWGRAGMPGPKSMAARQRSKRLNKILVGDVHANSPLGQISVAWEDDFTDEEIEVIAEEAVQEWHVDLDSVLKRTVGQKPNSSGGSQPYDERGRYAGADGKGTADDFFSTPSQGEVATAAREALEGIPIGIIGGQRVPEVVSRAVAAGSRALWKKGGETKIIIEDSFDDDPTASPTWAGAHYAGLMIRMNAKALQKVMGNGGAAEDVTYYTNHELAHSADAQGRAVKLGGYLSSTKYKDVVNGWQLALAKAEMVAYSTSWDVDPLSNEWYYATSYHKHRNDLVTSRAELFAEALSFAVTPHKRQVLKDTDAVLKSKGIGVSIEAGVQQILRDLGLEEEMHKARDTKRYGMTMQDFGGDGLLDPDEMEVRKLRLRARHGVLSILKRELGTKPNSAGQQQPYDEFGRWTSGGRISTAPPKGRVKGVDKPHPMHELRRLGVEQALKDDPAIGAKWVEKLSGVAGFGDLKLSKKAKPEEVKAVLDTAIERIKGNILDIHDRADPKDAKLWGEWYPIANGLGTKWAKENGGIHPDAVYAVMARLSPQADWNDNMTMAREVVRILHEDPVVTKDVLKAHRALQLKQAEMYKKEPDAPIPQNFEGLRLSELNDEDSAKMLRAISDTRGPLQVIDHTEKPMTKVDGDPRYVRWQSVDNLTRAISMWREPSFANISQQMGQQHKIRAFYNNIRDPHDTEFDDITVDTHAFGIGLGIPVTTASYEIASGPRSIPGGPNSTKAGTVGLYPIFAEAYRQAGAERGMLGRRMQSVTWEQWRKEWSPRARNEWMVDTARNVQHAVERGELTRSESWKVLKEFRDQLPGADGGGTNKEENITGRAKQFTPSLYDGKIDKRQVGTKPNSSGGSQPYDEHGRYTSGDGGSGGVEQDYDKQLARAQAIFDDPVAYQEHAARYDTSRTELEQYQSGVSSFAERYVPTWATAHREGRWRSGNRAAFENWKNRPYVSGYVVIDNEGFAGTLIEDNWKEW